MGIRKIAAAVGVSAITAAGLMIAPQTASAATAWPGCSGSALCYWENSGHQGGSISLADPDHGGGFCAPNYTAYVFSNRDQLANNEAGAKNQSANYTAFLFINHIGSDCDASKTYQPSDPLEVDPGVDFPVLPAPYKNNLMANTWY
ncbi:hypothetical protein C7C46_30435 [Streptomyces tateyamensis]|uniref:Peptidase M23 n=1 Tax=Streptomyces tateyamensis TaxID=565073 RepID=A0A2V4N816_9ACTN|nr:hypothetical protein [Streptomyces tateyamensis]PYC67366.1 hypothetical protein C7C46_30435 [Streptomyces tateyamensis]